MPHPAIEQVLKHFRFDHLPTNLQEVSRPFSELAQRVAENAPDNPETTVALRKLLEAKDAAVRAVLPDETSEQRQQRLTEAAKRGFSSK